MRVPAMRSGPAAAGAFGGRAARPAGAARVVPAISMSCLSACVGPNAYYCSHCGGDLDCWQACAGGTAECLSPCLAS
jgi:hypothetical protein